MHVLSTGVQHARTLTYLNIQTNNMSGRGLSSIVDGVYQGVGVMREIDIRGE